MKKVLILGAGLSASSLIRYLLEKSTVYNWQIRLVDADPEVVRRKLNGHPNGVALSFDATSSEARKNEIAQVDLVISMLPARFHAAVAKDCIELGRHLLTPSYVSPEMRALDIEAQEAGVLIMNEMGVDPGIDHMSAMQIIDAIRAKGGAITSFKSYCGGLIAPESDNNPWNYKFTWNPRNVVMAGSGGAAQYIDRHEYKYIPYQQVFTRLDALKVEGYGTFDGYANRDSLSYRAIYGLEDIPTFYRGTLRRSGFCQHWNIFVQLGMTEDSYQMQHSESLTPRNFLNAFLPYNETQSVEEKMRLFCAEHGINDLARFEWLGLFDNDAVIGIPDASPAQLLEHILVEKWKLAREDKDMIVMVHQFEYELEGRKMTIESSMVNIGQDEVYTSMSNLVGLPIGICAKMVLNGQLKGSGVHVPTASNVYEPILTELASDFGVRFIERQRELTPAN